jgi:DeoR/GlpR family transcriptional regulator of sugar metabolism
MIPISRQRFILDQIRKNKLVGIDSLREKLGVSTATIRRDLIELEKMSLIKRVNNGAIIKDYLESGFYLEDRKTKLIHEKERIASFAGNLVKDSETILIDSGSTTFQLSKFIKDKNQLTVITNSLDIVNELSRIQNITLISTGGAFLPELSIFVGFQAEASLSNFKVDKLFMGCQGISLDRGLLDSNLFAINLKKKMIETADQVFLLADHTKFGKNAPAVVTPLEKLDSIVTDKEVSSSWKDALNELGVKLVVV